MSEIVIREAISHDILAIDAVLRHAWKESGEAYPRPEYPAAMAYGLDLIGSGMVRVAVEKSEGGDRVVGVLMCRVGQWDMAPSQRYVENAHLYVMPDYRSKSVNGIPIGSALIDAAKFTAFMISVASNAIVPLRLTVDYPGFDQDVKAKLIERMGFQANGRTFLYVPQESDYADVLDAMSKDEAAEAAE